MRIPVAEPVLLALALPLFVPTGYLVQSGGLTARLVELTGAIDAALDQESEEM